MHVREPSRLILVQFGRLPSCLSNRPKSPQNLLPTACSHCLFPLRSSARPVVPPPRLPDLSLSTFPHQNPALHQTKKHRKGQRDPRDKNHTKGHTQDHTKSHTPRTALTQLTHSLTPSLTHTSRTAPHAHSTILLSIIRINCIWFSPIDLHQAPTDIAIVTVIVIDCIIGTCWIRTIAIVSLALWDYMPTYCLYLL